ncbi:inactive transglutaminase family protein [Agaribacterium haliotis]|uniref:inactive transglutaminase family protein n=1 Tax=Agaribacterium haliotis TaxID=2013869 RepID=UPI000BB58164|nr:inactive transglutaminase family protein [Agaribacterium haliotis]
MRHSKTPLYILVLILLISGISLTWQRHHNFQVPWLPGEQQQVWSVEAMVEFNGTGEPALVSLALPDAQTGKELISEFTASPGYGLAFAHKDGVRRAEWSVRQASGAQVLYYRAEFVSDADLSVKQTAPLLERSPLLTGSGPQITVARELLAEARQRSADAATLSRELVREFNQQGEAAALLKQGASREQWLVALLSEAGVPARIVEALELEDGRRRSQLSKYLQVFSDDEYLLIDPYAGLPVSEQSLLLWEYRSEPVLDVIGGRYSRVSFSVLEQKLPVRDIINQRRDHSSGLRDFSIHLLPLSEQALFKGILLIPIGVLVVCLLRILIGIKTAGTFMPVLIAIAFIQTSLITGLIGFVLIVGVGLLIRGYLSQLNLLLVARISTVIISVIILIAVLAVLSYQLGWTEGLKISFFPMIILSWTIERMSILWEEEGGREVLTQVGGSLFTAVITYALMMNHYVQHLTFNFLGLQLVIMALVLLLGTYTGYRLFELHRFYALVKRK